MWQRIINIQLLTLFYCIELVSRVIILCDYVILVVRVILYVIANIIVKHNSYRI